MSIVHHDASAEAVANLQQVAQWWHIAINAVNALNHDENSAVFALRARGLQHPRKMFRVRVAEAVPARAGQADAVQNAVVNKFVENHGVSVSAERLYQPHVCRLACREHDTCIGANKPGKHCFKLAV